MMRGLVVLAALVVAASVGAVVGLAVHGVLVAAERVWGWLRWTS